MSGVIFVMDQSTTSLQNLKVLKIEHTLKTDCDNNIKYITVLNLIGRSTI